MNETVFLQEHIVKIILRTFFEIFSTYMFIGEMIEEMKTNT